MPGGAHYIPRPDGDFAAWCDQFDIQTLLYWERYSLDTEMLTPLKNALAAWREAYPAHVAAQAAAEAARAAKDAARRELEKQARALARYVQANAFTTDSDRAELGITIPSGTRTDSPTPATRPRVNLEHADRLTHLLRIADETTPARSAKPPGVAGAEVWMALADSDETNPPPADAYRFLGLATSPSYRSRFAAATGGKRAFYQLRWLSTRGEPGPWSDLASATVAA